MTIPITQITYAGTALPQGSTTYVMFSTVAAGMGAGVAAQAGYKKLTFVCKNDNTGTLNIYCGNRAGTTWTLDAAQSVTATATTTSSAYEFLIESFPHFKLEWVNGGSNQTTFDPQMALIDERATA